MVRLVPYAITDLFEIAVGICFLNCVADEQQEIRKPLFIRQCLNHIPLHLSVSLFLSRGVKFRKEVQCIAV
jgi:hypothetical protein